MSTFIAVESHVGIRVDISLAHITRMEHMPGHDKWAVWMSDGCVYHVSAEKHDEILATMNTYSPMPV